MREPGLKGWGARDGTLYKDAPSADKQSSRVAMLANGLNFELCLEEREGVSALLLVKWKAGARSNNSTTNTLHDMAVNMDMLIDNEATHRSDLSRRYLPPGTKAYATVHTFAR